MPKPTKYTPELINTICETISTTSKGLRAICEDAGITTMCLMNWLADPDKKEFLIKYTIAKEIQVEILVDEMLEIADNTIYDTLTTKEGKEIPNSEWINRSRLRVDTRKWIASKLLPKKYGEKVDVTSGGIPIRQSFIIAGKEIEF